MRPEAGAASEVRDEAVATRVAASDWRRAGILSCYWSGESDNVILVMTAPLCDTRTDDGKTTIENLMMVFYVVTEG